VESTRSLSPMELDSPSSTPSQSPILLSAISLPEIDTSSGECHEPVPVALNRNDRVLSRLSDLKHPGAVGTHTTPLPRSSTVSQTAQTPHSGGNISQQINPYFVTRPTPTGPASLRSLTVNRTPSFDKDTTNPGPQGSVVKGPATSASPLQSATGPSNVLADAASRDEDMSRASPTSPSSIPAKRKPVVQNPFVSAGFMTEFVGSSVPKKVPESLQPRPAAQTVQGPSGKVNILAFAAYFH
jgi:hypothetical protein